MGMGRSREVEECYVLEVLVLRWVFSFVFVVFVIFYYVKGRGKKRQNV